MESRTNPINVFAPKFRSEEILTEIGECLEKGWTGLGFKTIEFENAWSKYTGLANSHFLSSNTVGLHLAIKILKMVEGWNEGDEIITTPLTFVSTNHSILYENMSPVFADVDEYLCLDPESVKKRITHKTRAVMFVGLGGNTGKLDKIQKICEEKNIRLILDSAHMAGTYVKSNNGPKHVGKEADIVVFSFQSVKNLPTADSGIICFKNPEHLEIAKKLSWLGIDKDTYSRTTSGGNYKWKYDVPNVGYKYHGNSIMASMALVQLRYLDEDNDRRNQISELYNQLFEKEASISLINKAPYCHKSSRHLYQVIINNRTAGKISARDKLIQHLYDNQIFPGVHYIDNTNYPMYNHAVGSCPKAKQYSDTIITLPIHLHLRDVDVERVSVAVMEGLALI